MAAALSARVLEKLPDASASYHRLVLVVGPARSGKTEALLEMSTTKGWPRINVNLRLAEQLLDLTQKVRAVRVAGLLEDLVQAASREVVLLDNIEMLFAAELAQDPLRLIQGLSRNRTIVAAWPGTYDGQALMYAEPGHHEFKKYTAPDAVMVLAAGNLPSDRESAREESE